MIPADYRFSPDLPPAIAARLRAALDDDIAQVIEAAYAELNYPDEGAPPTFDSLSPAQRAFATTLMDCSLWADSNRSRLPNESAKRRWLGLEPAGPLEEPVDFELDERQRREPLWRAVRLMELRDERQLGPRVTSFVGALPIARRYALWGLANLTWPAPWGLHADTFFALESRGAELGPLVDGSAGAWAALFLDQMLRARSVQPNVGSTLLPFVAAVRAKIPLEPRWDTLLPTSGLHALVDECLLAIPPARRASTLVGYLARVRFPSQALKTAIRILPLLPEPAILAQALALVPAAGGSQRLHLRALRDAVGARPELLALITSVQDAAGPPLVLRALAVRAPSTLAELSDEDRAQLQIAGKRYHGKAVALATLMSDTPDEEEQSLRAGLTYVALGNEKGKHVYDAWLYAVDSGTVFAKRGTRVVAERAQFAIECKDEKLADALETVLRSPIEILPEAVPAERAPTAKAAAKKRKPKP